MKTHRHKPRGCIYYAEAVEGIRQGYEDMKAGLTVPAEQVFDDMRRKHGFPSSRPDKPPAHSACCHRTADQAPA
jgi:hypothetical protein